MKTKKTKSPLNIESGIHSLQLIFKRKAHYGERLTPVEHHLLANSTSLKKSVFAPSVLSVIASTLQALSLPLLLLGGICLAGAKGYDVYQGSESAILEDEVALERAVKLAEQGIEIDQEFSLRYSSLRDSVEVDGTNSEYKKSLINFIAGVITVYQPSLTDGARIATDIVEISEKADIDPFYVAAIISVESRFHPHARSHVGATGLMQLLPTTAKEVSEKRSGRKQYPQLTHSRTNIELGIDYLKTLESQFNGNRHHALAAYNWGPANVERVKKNVKSIPRSVENYARTILERTLRWQRHFRSVEKSTEGLNQAEKVAPVQEARNRNTDII